MNYWGIFVLIFVIVSVFSGMYVISKDDSLN